MTHEKLVTVAASWLRRQRCGVVLTEHVGAGGVEIPDAIGFRKTWAIQVECKVSLSDFRRDALKACRAPLRDRQANERWYLTPVGLVPKRLRVGDATPFSDWGLLEYDGRKVTRVIPARTGVDVVSESVLRASVLRMFYELRRYQVQGIKYRIVREMFAEKRERDLVERTKERRPRRGPLVSSDSDSYPSVDVSTGRQD